jgi:hypothetical protein
MYIQYNYQDIYMYTLSGYIYVYIYTHTHTHTHTYILWFPQTGKAEAILAMCVTVFLFVSYMYIIYIYIYIYIHTHTHIHTYIHTYIKAEAILAGGAECSITPLSFAGFAAMRAMATDFNDDPKRASRPFDKKRAGFV